MVHRNNEYLKNKNILISGYGNTKWQRQMKVRLEKSAYLPAGRFYLICRSLKESLPDPLPDEAYGTYCPRGDTRGE
jgi:hypothetical protein